MPSNTTKAPGFNSRRDPIPVRMAAFDELPPRARDTLNSTVIKWSAPSALAQFKSLLRSGVPSDRAESIIVENITRADRVAVQRSASEVWGHLPILKATDFNQPTRGRNKATRLQRIRAERERKAAAAKTTLNDLLAGF